MLGHSGHYKAGPLLIGAFTGHWNALIVVNIRIELTLILPTLLYSK